MMMILTKLICIYIEMSLTFSPKTRVRNLYTVENPNTGESEVEVDEYNANATGNNAMPGYSMHNPRFRPHSKSSIQKAETVMKNLRKQQLNEQRELLNAGFNLSSVNRTVFNTGLSPSISANSYPGYVNYRVNLAGKARNMHTMQAIYGDNWVEAAAELETIEEEADAAMAQVNEEFIQRRHDLETEIARKTGNKSHIEISRVFIEKRNQLDNSGLQGSEYRQALRLITAEFAAAYNKIRKEDLVKEQPAYDALIAYINNKIFAYDAIKNARIAQIRVGRPIGVRNRRTLKNRLNAAHNVAEAEAPTIPAVEPSKSCFGNCGYT